MLAPIYLVHYFEWYKLSQLYIRHGGKITPAQQMHIARGSERVNGIDFMRGSDLIHSGNCSGAYGTE